MNRRMLERMKPGRRRLIPGFGSGTGLTALPDVEDCTTANHNIQRSSLPQIWGKGYPSNLASPEGKVAVMATIGVTERRPPRAKGSGLKAISLQYGERAPEGYSQVIHNPVRGNYERRKRPDHCLSPQQRLRQCLATGAALWDALRMGAGMRYFTPRKPGKLATHIWVGDDTACRMYSTGGLRRSDKYTVAAKPRSKICSMCRHNARKAVKKAELRGDIRAKAARAHKQHRRSITERNDERTLKELSWL